MLITDGPLPWPEQRAGDVYVVEPKPLEEGVEKHIISIFVADEPGLINRVAGVFARRGERMARRVGPYPTAPTPHGYAWAFPVRPPPTPRLTPPEVGPGA